MEENTDTPRHTRPPLWFIAILVVLTAPGLIAPALLPTLPAAFEELKIVVKLYPLYVLASSWFAYICYRQRPTVAWILVALALLCDIAMFSLYRLY